MAAPVFSVVLRTRNRAKLLVDVLESLLAGDFRPQDFELCLVDNDSSDGTAVVR